MRGVLQVREEAGRGMKHDRILLAHGGGGSLTHELIERVFAPAFGMETLEDSAVREFGGQKLAFTTDSYVVNPYFFPGGDIGKLAPSGHARRKTRRHKDQEHDADCYDFE